MSEMAFQASQSSSRSPMRQRITGRTTMSTVGIGDVITIETGTIAFIVAGIMMGTVVGVVDKVLAWFRLRRVENRAPRWRGARSTAR